MTPRINSSGKSRKRAMTVIWAGRRCYRLTRTSWKCAAFEGGRYSGRQVSIMLGWTIEMGREGKTRRGGKRRGLGRG